MALMFILGTNGIFESSFLLCRPGAAFALDAVALDRGQHAGGLFATHHRDACIGPHPQKAWRKSASAHAIVTGAETAADDHRQLRHSGGGDGGDHLCTVARNALIFNLAADHEAGDVLQKNERDLALTAELDEMA